MVKFPFYKQFDERDCGPASLRMICKFYGKSFSLESLRESCHINKYGTSLLSLSDGAEEVGFRTLPTRLTSKKLYERGLLPCVAFVNGNHFIVIHKITSKHVYVANPAIGLQKLLKKEFESMWLQEGREDQTGVIMMLEPTPEFDLKKSGDKKTTFGYFTRYVSPYRREITQIVIGLLFGSLVAFIVPFISQAIMDHGINGQNLEFIQIMIIAQIILTISSTLVGVIQSWLQLHIGTRMSVAMLSDFIMKILRLPMSFIQNRTIGDIMQRMSDNGRILAFITGSPISILFSILNLVIYGGIMVSYNLPILLVFVVGNILYGFWLFAFLNKRKELDHEGFAINSENENHSIELFQGIQDIKLNNLERQKRWQWEDIQAKSYELSLKGLKINQIQSSGTLIINQTKNILISYIAASAVISGDMTLGMMFSVQYMIGQLNQPFSTFLGFIHSIQDVKISMERLSEINDKEPEGLRENYLSELPPSRTITIKNLTFRYEGKSSDPALNEINLELPENGITAIVGKSGSGKTTLLKLLLKLYDPSEGKILIGKDNLDIVRTNQWRNVCGAVLQDSYIFNDTISNNIMLHKEHQDRARMVSICEKLNISEFVDRLPQKFETKIGEGNYRLSTGQNQRLLLARCIYKNPDILILDEVTSSLDTENENTVMQYLNELKQGRNIIIAAHRLSTVMNADQIIVIDEGKVVEKGTHEQLLTNKDGVYYKLVTSKLDL